MEIISGGVTAPIGFLAAGMHAGVRKNKKKKRHGIASQQVSGEDSWSIYTECSQGCTCYVGQSIM